MYIKEIKLENFRNYSLEKIKFSESIKHIGKHCFFNKEYEEIGYCVNNVLTEITIPASVTEIGDAAFGGFQKLNKVNYNGSYKDKFLNEKIFENCPNLKF